MKKGGIVGCGFMGRMHATVFDVLSSAELVGFYDDKPERAKEFADQFGKKAFDSMEELAEHCDALHLCTPTDTHAELTKRAAGLGQHVFCEKPMAVSREQADDMIHACVKANVTLMIGHCIRFWPEYTILKKLVDERAMGGLRSVNLLRYGGFPTWSVDGWLEQEGRAGGGVLDMHIHDTDFILYLLGEPDSMTTRGTINETGPAHVFTNMAYGDTVAHLEGGWNLPPGTPFKMAFRAIFERGAAIWDGGPLTIYEDGKEPEVPELTRMAGPEGGNISDLGGYFFEIAHFYDKIAKGEPLDIVTPQTSRQSLDYCLREIEAIKSFAHS